MKHLSNKELDLELSEKAKTERKIAHEVLLYIQEVDKRSLHLEYGYSSLAEYLVKRHHYSEGSAYRRIGAMRMLSSIPEVKEQLIKGSLNLTQLSIAQSVIYKKQKQTNTQVTKEEKLTLLKELEHKSMDQTKMELANTFDIDIETMKQVTYGKEESVYVNLKLTKEEYEVIREWQSLMSHQVKDHKELFINLCKKLIKSKMGVTPNNKTNPHVDRVVSMDGSTPHQGDKSLKPKMPMQSAFATKAKPQTRYITAKTRRWVFQRDNCECQYISKEGHKCRSKLLLQPHHVKAYAKGGSNTIENLSLRCRAHNLFEQRKKGSSGQLISWLAFDTHVLISGSMLDVFPTEISSKFSSHSPSFHKCSARVSEHFCHAKIR